MPFIEIRSTVTRLLQGVSRMGISPVQKGQKLTAQAWNQLATTVNNIAGGSTAAASAGKVVQVTIRNRTDIAKRAGEILTVYKTGSLRLAQYTPDEARVAWMNNGFQLDGYAALPSNSSSAGVPALLIDGIPASGIGRAVVYGLCAGYISVSGASAPELVKFSDSTGAFVEPASGETGDWRVIASSAVSSGRVFAYLVPLGGGGGGSIPVYWTTNGSNVSSADAAALDFTQYPSNNLVRASMGSNGRLEIKIANWTLSGGTNPVTNVTVDSNGDIVLERTAITLGRSFS